jgi:copper chaperone CopZ
VRLLTFYGPVLLFAVTKVVVNSFVNEVQINAQDGHVDQTRDSNDDGVEAIFQAREDVQYKNKGLRGIEWVNLGRGRQETCELRRVFALRSGSVLACRMNGGNSEAKAATLGCILPPGFSAGTDGARHGAAVRLEDLTLV